VAQTEETQGWGQWGKTAPTKQLVVGREDQGVRKSCQFSEQTLMDMASDSKEGKWVGRGLAIAGVGTETLQAQGGHGSRPLRVAMPLRRSMKEEERPYKFLTTRHMTEAKRRKAPSGVGSKEVSEVSGSGQSTRPWRNQRR
jgi:hypothetical protein